MNFFAIFSRFGSSHSVFGNGAPYRKNSSLYIPESDFRVANSGGSFWILSLFAGLVFVVLSVLLIIYPELLAFFFAGIMLFIGLFFISTALFIRSLKRNRS
jgi:hypothetical protein